MSSMNTPSDTSSNVAYIPSYFDTERCWKVCFDLFEKVEWKDAPPTRKRLASGRKEPTHKFCRYHLGTHEDVDDLIVEAMEKLLYPTKAVYGCYFEHYAGKNAYTPCHINENTDKIIIALGAQRPFLVERKKYLLGNGDVICHGPVSHGVPKSSTIVGESIHIVVYIAKIWI